MTHLQAIVIIVFLGNWWIFVDVSEIWIIFIGELLEWLHCLIVVSFQVLFSEFILQRTERTLVWLWYSGKGCFGRWDGFLFQKLCFCKMTIFRLEAAIELWVVWVFLIFYLCMRGIYACDCVLMNTTDFAFYEYRFNELMGSTKMSSYMNFLRWRIVTECYSFWWVSVSCHPYDHRLLGDSLSRSSVRVSVGQLNEMRPAFWSG